MNAATYRCCVQGRDRLSVWMLGTAHGRVIAEKYWKRGQSCPIAVVVGQDPILSTAAAMPVPAGSSEYDLAGGLRGEPVRLVRLPGSGLVVPAGAEIVIEGELPPVTGIGAGGTVRRVDRLLHALGPGTMIRVKRILHRDDPIILGAPPMIPTVPAGDQAVPLYAASVTWEQLENSGVGNVRAVWAYARQLMMVISIEQRAPGDPMRALLAAAGRKRAGGMERFFVVVDPDIDVSNLNKVLWAILTRADPATSIQTLRTATSVLDPRLPPQRRADVTIPWASCSSTRASRSPGGTSSRRRTGSPRTTRRRSASGGIPCWPGETVRLPAEVADLLRGRPGLGSAEQAFPFLTVDSCGYPHSALLSRTELEPAADGTLLAAVGSPGTRANLLRDGRAGLIAVHGTVCSHLKLRLEQVREDGDLLGCVLAVDAHKPDSLDIELRPLGFSTGPELARREDWQRSARMLAALALERTGD